METERLLQRLRDVDRRLPRSFHKHFMQQPWGREYSSYSNLIDDGLPSGALIALTHAIAIYEAGGYALPRRIWGEMLDIADRLQLKEDVADIRDNKKPFATPSAAPSVLLRDKYRTLQQKGVDAKELFRLLRQEGVTRFDSYVLMRDLYDLTLLECRQLEERVSDGDDHT